MDIWTQKDENGSLFHTLHKNQLKWIKDLNVRSKIVKFLEENIKAKLLDVGLGNGYDTKSTENKIKLNKWDYIKHKTQNSSK